MAITGISSNERHIVICKDDPCQSIEDGATGFHTSPISNAVITRIHDQQQTASMNFGDVQTQTFQNRTAYRNRECFRFGVKGWDNFFGDDGLPIEFSTMEVMEGGQTYTVVSNSCLDRVRLATINEVGDEIWKRNTMSEKQRKNFEVWSSRFEGSNTSNARTAERENEQSGDVIDQQSGQAQETDDPAPPKGVAILAPINTGKTPSRKSGKTAAHVG